MRGDKCLAGIRLDGIPRHAKAPQGHAAPVQASVRKSPTRCCFPDCADGHGISVAPALDTYHHPSTSPQAVPLDKTTRLLRRHFVTEQSPDLLETLAIPSHLLSIVDLNSLGAPNRSRNDALTDMTARLASRNPDAGGSCQVAGTAYAIVHLTDSIRYPDFRVPQPRSHSAPLS